MAVRVVLDFRGPQPGAGLLTRQISAGDRQLAIVTNTPSQADAIVRSDDFDVNLRFTALAQNKKSVPNISRQGPMYMDPNDPIYGNRPKIEILPLDSLGDSNAVVVKTFDQMILAGVQEQDSEKTDVHETFGVPHFFASGRFVRRFSFSGAVRAAPVNYQSREPALKVTQYVLMRLFYETFMRITVQAQKRWYTRITVNREIYEGFVSTMNFNTNAETEHFIPFVFSMFGIARRNAALDAAGTEVIGPEPGKTKQSSRNSAQAEVNDAIPRSSMKALPNSTDIGVLSFNNPTQSPDAHESVNLTFAPRPELITVRGDTPGIDLVYDPSLFVGSKRGIPLHGSMPPTAGPFPVSFLVSNYWQLYNAVQRRLLPATGQPVSQPGLALIPGIATFSITTASKQNVKVAVRFSLSPPENVTVINVLGSLDGSNIGRGSLITPGSANSDVFLGEVHAADAFDGSNNVTLDLKYFLGTRDGSPVPPAALVGATVLYDIQSVYAALGSALIKVDNIADAAICTASIDLTDPLVASSGDNSLSHSLIFGLKSTVLLSDENPLVEADRIVIKVRPTLILKNYPAVKLPSLSMSIYMGAAASRNVLKALTFAGAIWSPVQAVVSDTKTGGTQQRLDRFGFLNFFISTADSLDVAKSVYAAIQSGSLAFQTRFASQEPQSSARLGLVPLNGTSYGTGELMDPETGLRVYLRTRLAALTFDKSTNKLFMSIEINTTFQSGFSAYLYSARFWAYISDVVSAHLQIPSSASITPPVSFG